MAEYVWKVTTGSAELQSIAPILVEVVPSRSSDYGECAAARDLLSAYRDRVLPGETSIGNYHVCNHDIGQGDCSGAVQVF